jgi:hypothetical protein
MDAIHTTITTTSSNPINTTITTSTSSNPIAPDTTTVSSVVVHFGQQNECERMDVKESSDRDGSAPVVSDCLLLVALPYVKKVIVVPRRVGCSTIYFCQHIR